MDSIINRHIEIYHEDYDDSDRYFDFFYKFYKNISKYIYNKVYDILDNNNFVDFFDFCVKHMNREIVDDIILSRDIEQLHQDLSCHMISNDDYVDYDESPDADEVKSTINSKHR